MSLPEQLPRAKPTDEGPFLMEIVPPARARGRWWAPGGGFTSDVEEALCFSKSELDARGWWDFEESVTYPVCVPSLPIFDLSTRLGRVQAAWWLRDRGAPQDVMSFDERRAYGCALIGDDKCDVEALAALVERYKEAP